VVPGLATSGGCPLRQEEIGQWHSCAGDGSVLVTAASLPLLGCLVRSAPNAAAKPKVGEEGRGRKTKRAAPPCTTAHGGPAWEPTGGSCSSAAHASLRSRQQLGARPARTPQGSGPPPDIPGQPPAARPAWEPSGSIQALNSLAASPPLDSFQPARSLTRSLLFISSAVCGHRGRGQEGTGG